MIQPCRLNIYDIILDMSFGTSVRDRTYLRRVLVKIGIKNIPIKRPTWDSRGSSLLPMNIALQPHHMEAMGCKHYCDVIMGAMAQITSLTIVCSAVHSGADQMWGIHRSPVNSRTNGQ